MNKKESWIIDNKYFNCESMTLCLQRKANIRKLICNKKTKELHLDKIKRPILVWLFCGLPSLRLLLFTSFWESRLSWQAKTFVEAFLKLKSVSKYFKKKKTKTKKKKKTFLYSLSLASNYKERFFAFQTMPWWTSLNNNGRWSQVILKRRKDLHTIALFRWVLGWAGLLITFLCNSLPRTMFRNYCYILMKTGRINCYWLINRRSLRKQNTRQLKISGKRFSKRVFAIFIILQFPFCNNARTKRFPFCLYSVFWVLTLV